MGVCINIITVHLGAKKHAIDPSSSTIDLDLDFANRQPGQKAPED